MFLTTTPLPKTVCSSDELRASLLANLDRYEVASFDVFDTLVRRRVHPPELVKCAASRWLAERLGREGVDVAPDEVHAARRQVERQLRAASRAAQGDDECTLDDVLAALASRWLDPPAATRVAGEARTQELQIERSMLGAMPGMSTLLAALRRAGKRVVLCSDMYLSADDIRSLLTGVGYDLDGVGVYVSCEARVSKGSGRLFRHVLAAEAVDAATVVHVGDNAASDVRAPRRLGIAAIHFRHRLEQQRQRGLATLGRRARRHRFWRGAYVNAVCQPLERLPPRDSFHYEYGRGVLGLPHAAFLHGVIDRVRREGIEQLLFVAREGFLYRRLYETIWPALGGGQRGPKLSYLCATRRSTDPNSAGEHAAELTRYLQQAGFWGKGRKVALVDVGWQGTIGTQLRRLFGDRSDFPELFGFYLGRVFHPGKTPDDAFGEGVLRDPARRDIGERSLMEFIPLLEEAARAPHGTTRGYRFVDRSDVRAVFDDGPSPNRAAELINNPALAALQQGIIDFAARYAETLTWSGYTSDDVMPYVAAHLTRALCLPRRHEARELLRFMRHAPDDGHQQAGTLGQVGFRAWRWDDWQAVAKRGVPIWRQGVLAQASRSLSWLFTLKTYLRRWEL
jgi:FMN phosphatase YigB (HAD superfamily)